MVSTTVSDLPRRNRDRAAESSLTVNALVPRVRALVEPRPSTRSRGPMVPAVALWHGNLEFENHGRGDRRRIGDRADAERRLPSWHRDRGEHAQAPGRRDDRRRLHGSRRGRGCRRRRGRGRRRRCRRGRGCRRGRPGAQVEAREKLVVLGRARALVVRVGDAASGVVDRVGVLRVVRQQERHRGGRIQHRDSEEIRARGLTGLADRRLRRHREAEGHGRHLIGRHRECLADLLDPTAGEVRLPRLGPLGDELGAGEHDHLHRPGVAHRRQRDAGDRSRPARGAERREVGAASRRAMTRCTSCPGRGADRTGARAGTARRTHTSTHYRPGSGCSGSPRDRHQTWPPARLPQTAAQPPTP